jgi:hypothetical protein
MLSCIKLVESTRRSPVGLLMHGAMVIDHVRELLCQNCTIARAQNNKALHAPQLIQRCDCLQYSRGCYGVHVCFLETLLASFPCALYRSPTLLYRAGIMIQAFHDIAQEHWRRAFVELQILSFCTAARAGVVIGDADLHMGVSS